MYQLRGRVGRVERARVRVLLLPAAARADRGGARAAHDDRAAPGARQRVPDRAARPRDPRRRQRARRRAARPHRGGRVRHVRAAAAGVGRRDEGRAAAGGEGDPHRPAGEGVRARRDGSRRRRSAWTCTGGSVGRRPRACSSASATETVDRYGQLPQEVETLFAVASLRITCATARRRRRSRPTGSRCGSSRSTLPELARGRPRRAGPGGDVPRDHARR